MSVLEKLKALDEERSKLLEGAKAEALATAQKGIEVLNELGFHYRLVEGSQTARRAATRASTADGEPKRQRKDIPCPICAFKTDPLHDGRAHRSQEIKKPFTGEELTERGLTKVG